MRTKLHSLSKQRLTGFALIAAGALLLAASGAYYAYGEVAKSRLGELSYSADRPSPAGYGQPLPRVGAVKNVPDSAGAAGIVSSRSRSQRDHAAGLSATQTVVGSNTPAQQAGSVTAGRETVVEAAKSAGPAPAAPRTAVQGADAVARSSGKTETAAPRTAVPSPGTSARSAVVAAQPAPRVRSKPDSPKASVATLNRAGVSISTSKSVESSNEARPSQTVVAAAAGNGSTVRVVRSAPSGDASDGPAPSVSLARPAPAPEVTTDQNDGGSPPVLTISKPQPTALEAELAKYLPPDKVDLGDGPLPATRIRIPTIAVDSGIKDLELVSSKGSLAWETPKNIVGHIPTTARPAGQGEGWYFGHLESLIRGEGNVFLRLPEIPRLAEAGPVYVVLEDGVRSYLYQVYKTEVMHRDDLKIRDSGTQDITLVTCVPRFVYDHRLVVTAALVGVKES